MTSPGPVGRAGQPSLMPEFCSMNGVPRRDHPLAGLGSPPHLQIQGGIEQDPVCRVCGQARACHIVEPSAKEFAPINASGVSGQTSQEHRHIWPYKAAS